MLPTNTIRQGLDEIERLLDETIDEMAAIKVFLDRQEIHPNYSEADLHAIIETLQLHHRAAGRLLDRVEMLRKRLIHFGDLALTHRKTIPATSLTVIKHRVQMLAYRMQRVAHALGDIFELDITSIAQRVEDARKRLEHVAAPTRAIEYRR
jgi:hypothetical protein